MHLRPVLHILGRLVGLLALAMLVPALCGLFYNEMQAVGAFLVSAMITGAIGFVMVLAGRRDSDLHRPEGILIVVGGWLMASLLGALPYLLTGSIVHPVDALFESASGFTTTGSTILLEIESLGYAVSFWRCFTQWLGGMGIIVLFVALMPELGIGGRLVYKLEVPGPTASTLHPRVQDTANVLWRIYLMLTAAEVLALLAVGMGPYDALTHTFSTLSTGGFSPRNASVAAFDSPMVEIVIIVFMFLAGANFSLFYGFRPLGVKRGLKEFLSDTELRIYGVGTLALSFVIFFSVWFNGHYENAARAYLDSLFQLVSILTTTGFGTADFDTWPNFSRLLLVGLMFVGGCAGSTAGGMKIVRVVIGLKAAFREVRLMFSPNSVLAIFVGKTPAPNPVVASIMGFLLLYIGAWVLGTFALTLGGTDLETSASAAIAVLGNIGPGLSGVGATANFAFFEWWQKIVMVRADVAGTSGSPADRRPGYPSLLGPVSGLMPGWGNSTLAPGVDRLWAYRPRCWRRRGLGPSRGGST